MSKHASTSRAAIDDGDIQLYHGDVLTVLRSLPAGLVQTCVTSPPYWGLRDYGTGAWDGGDPDCEHRVGHQVQDTKAPGAIVTGQRPGVDASRCLACGARRVDSQLGLEASPDLYVERMVAVFREVRRVLRDDGTVWLNLGDSYNGGGTIGRKDGETLPTPRGGHRTAAAFTGTRPDAPGLKPKDLIGIPWRVAFALQADGWYLRSDIIWNKPNPMPESVTDRPTKAHEYLFLLAKQPRYYMDMDAIREPHNGLPSGNLASKPNPAAVIGNGDTRHSIPWQPDAAGRNRRSVWTIPTEPFPEAHFATYPQELVRPCILAGTSERGECSECGTPWQRQVEREHVERGVPRTPTGRADKPYGMVPGSNTRGVPFRSVTGEEWRPSCSCGAPTRPQTVLDPFIGSGTTALVARKHGRRCIGIDLSAEYLDIAARRTQQLSLLGDTA